MCLGQALTPCPARQVFTALYNTDDNCLVAAPTGSGKTACAEFAVLRMVQRASDGACAARAVYIALVPALARERLADWKAKVRLCGLLLPDTVRNMAQHSVLRTHCCLVGAMSSSSADARARAHAPGRSEAKVRRLFYCVCCV